MLKQVSEHKREADIETDFPLINAVLLGVQQGNIFEDETNLFIIHKAGFSFFKQKKAAANYDNFIKLILNSSSIPRYFHVYDPPEELISQLGKNAHIQTRIRKRIHLKYVDERFSFKFSADENFSVQRITSDNFESLSVFDLQITSKFWNSKEDFLKNGFGFFVFAKKNEPVSVCYTACVADGEAEIDIATLGRYQKKGLAKKAASSFVQHCINNNIIANWDCFEDNIASLRVAEQIGFSQKRSYIFLSIFNS